MGICRVSGCRFQLRRWLWLATELGVVLAGTMAFANLKGSDFGFWRRSVSAEAKTGGQRGDVSVRNRDRRGTRSRVAGGEFRELESGRCREQRAAHKSGKRVFAGMLGSAAKGGGLRDSVVVVATVRVTWPRIVI